VSVAGCPGPIADAAVSCKLFRVLADNPSGADLIFSIRALARRGWLLRASEPGKPVLARELHSHRHKPT